MKVLGNVLWIIFGGLVMFLSWIFAGIIFCITIIGIPLGKQCFKIGGAFLTPFGKTVKTNFGKHPILNIIWLIVLGWENALACVIMGILCCITIIGIPFGKQWFKLSGICLIPFGATIG